jgi:hypothetical protein
VGELTPGVTPAGPRGVRVRVIGVRVIGRRAGELGRGSATWTVTQSAERRVRTPGQ